MRPLFAPHLSSLLPYVPGKPIEETEREFEVRGVAKLASNENCLGPSPKATEALRAFLAHGHLYPDAGGFYLKERLLKLHAAHGISASQIVLGNGTNELITLLGRALLGVGDKLLNAWPSFVVYRIIARAQGVPEVVVPLDASLGYDLPALARAAADDDAIKLVFIANPNNPTGRMITRAQLEQFFAAVPSDLVVVLDEAYAEYVVDPAYPDGLAWVQRRPRTADGQSGWTIDARPAGSRAARREPRTRSSRPRASRVRNQCVLPPHGEILGRKTHVMGMPWHLRDRH